MKKLFWILFLVATPTCFANDFSLQWCGCNDPADLGGYNLHYGESSGAYTNTVDVGTATTWDVRGLPGGKTYFFAVTAYGSGDQEESEYSEEVARFIDVNGCSCEPGDPADPPVTPQGLVAAYGFEEALTDTQVLDTSGEGNDGVLEGAQRVEAGKYGRALVFDGDADYVQIPDADSLDLTTGMTIEAWLQPTAQSHWTTALLKETTDGLVYALFGYDGAPKPAAYAKIGTWVAVDGIEGLPLNVWTHVAATFDGSVFRLFVNGVMVREQAVVGSITVSDGSLWIGGTNRWLDEMFTGYIDEVRVYNRALSEAEINADMFKPIALILQPRMMASR